MNFLIGLGLLIIGFGILVVGGEALVRASVSLAVRWRLTPAVISLTVLATGTSAPELVTSVLATFKNTPDIALGNVVGSNIFNILAILGVASLLKPNRVPRSTLTLELPFLLGASLLVVALARDLTLEQINGLLFLVLLVSFLTLSVVLAKRRASGETEEMSQLSSITWDGIYLVIGFAALLGGAHLALEGGIQLGNLFGLSERIIGITIISVGTGLPELATSAVAAYRGHNDIAVANVVGSNIMNTLGVIGATSAIQPLTVSARIVHWDSLWMIGAVIILFPLILYGRMSLGRLSGLLLSALYILYIAWLIAQESAPSVA